MCAKTNCNHRKPKPQTDPLCNFEYITRNGNKRGPNAKCDRIASECNYHRKLLEPPPHHSTSGAPLAVDLPRLQSCHELRLLRLRPDGDLRLTAETGTALSVIKNFQIYPGIAELPLLLIRTHPCYHYRAGGELLIRTGI